MAGSTGSVCRSCGASIVWAETTKGKRMPVDAEPSEDGNIRLVDRGGDVPLAVYDSTENQPLFEDSTCRYLSHFVTCPEAPDWRKR